MTLYVCLSVCPSTRLSVCLYMCVRKCLCDIVVIDFYDIVVIDWSRIAICTMTITAWLRTAGRKLTRTQVNSDPSQLGPNLSLSILPLLYIFVCVFCVYKCRVHI